MGVCYLSYSQTESKSKGKNTGNVFKNREFLDKTNFVQKTPEKKVILLDISLVLLFKQGTYY